MEQNFEEHYEETASFKAVKLGPAAPVSSESQVSTTFRRPRPLKTASVAQPAPQLSGRAPRAPHASNLR